MIDLSYEFLFCFVFSLKKDLSTKCVPKKKKFQAEEDRNGHSVIGYVQQPIRKQELSIRGAGTK